MHDTKQIIKVTTLQQMVQVCALLTRDNICFTAREFGHLWYIEICGY